MGQYCPKCGEYNLREHAQYCDQCGAMIHTFDDNQATKFIPNLSSPSSEDTQHILGNDPPEQLIPASDQEDKETIDIPSESLEYPEEYTKPISDGKGESPEETRFFLEENEASVALLSSNTISIPNLSESEEETKSIPEKNVRDRNGSEENGNTLMVRSDEDDSGPFVEKEWPLPVPQKKSILKFQPEEILQHRYRIKKILGQGGFGAVYLAEDMNLDRLCVVKQMLTTITSPQALEVYRKNFEREARLLAQLNHPGHPNIPEIHDHFSERGTNYLIMKYIEGRNLKQVIEESETPPDWEQMKKHIVDLLDALDYMHTHFKEPIMHRDIKPANILLGDDDRIWLVDFGLAKAQPVEETATDANVSRGLGSFGYTPLEQWLGEATPASDVYALGATLHHLFTLHDPTEDFEGKFNIHKLILLHGQFEPIFKINSNLEIEICNIIHSMIITDAEQRPTALQLKQQFSVFVTGAYDTPLFTFKNGQVAQTKHQLVDLCDQYKPEARGYLYRGDFERWFRLTNRNDLAKWAKRAVNQGKNRQAGLEIFLRLILPNLTLWRLRRASLRIGRFVLQTSLLTLMIVLIFLMSGIYLAQWGIQSYIQRRNWDFENSYTEIQLNQLVQQETEGLFDDISIDLQTPDQFQVFLRRATFALELPPITLSLEENNKPRFQMQQVTFPFNFATDKILEGINNGFENYLKEAEMDISQIEIRDEVLLITQNGSTSSLPPKPMIPPNATSSTPFSAVPSVPMEIVNELEQDIVLKIGGWQGKISAQSQWQIKIPSGTYTYTIESVQGDLMTQGQKTINQDTFHHLYIR